MKNWIDRILHGVVLLTVARGAAAQVPATAVAPAAPPAFSRQLPACIQPQDVVNVDWRNSPSAVSEWGVPVAPVVSMYVVPAGKHLVLLEASITTEFGQPLGIAPCLRLVEIDGPTTRVKLNHYATYFAAAPSGLVFSPGSTVAAVFDIACLPDPQARIRYQLTGYLQGVASPGCLKATDIVNVDWKSAPAAGPNGLAIASGVATEVWTVPAGKRFVLQQFLGVAGAHIGQSIGGQVTHKRDLINWGGGVSELVPFGLVFEPGSTVVLTGSLGGVPSQAVKFDLVGYLQDV